MKLFDTLFEAFKYTWKEKPMWKFILAILAPILLIFTILIMGFAVFMILTDGAIDVPFSIGKQASIFLTIGFLLITLVYVIVNLGGTIGTQLGTNGNVWHHYLSPAQKMDKGLVSRMIKKQILPSLPFYLLFVVLPYCGLLAVYFGFFYFMEISDNPLVMMGFILLLFLFIPIIFIGFYLLHLVLPVLGHDTVAYKDRIRNLWAYIRSNFLNLFLYSLMVGVADFIANTILYIPYYIFSMIVMVPFILGISLLENNSIAAILLFIVMTVLYSIVVTLYSVAQMLFLTFRQAAFTTMYCHWYKTSETAQQIAPLPQVMQFEE